MLCAVTNEQEYYHIFLLYIYICILLRVFLVSEHMNIKKPLVFIFY